MDQMQQAAINDDTATAPRNQRIRSAPKRRISRETVSGYLFILPSIIGLTLFVLYPLIATIVYSLTRWDGLAAPQFIGFENFRYMFASDPSFWPSLRATLIYVVLSVPASLVAGLGLAVLLNRANPGIRLFRTIFYLPTVLPLIASLTLWKFIYHPQFGMANALLQRLGLPTSLWLGSEQMAIPAMVLIGVWGVGATMIIFLAGLQAVPQQLYEAAQLDGANSARSFLNITLPMISPILFLQLVMQIIASLQAFAQPKVLTGGGPNNATNFLMYSIYTTGFGNLSQYPALGYAMTKVIVLFVIIAAVTILTFRFSTIWVYADNTVE